MSDQEQESTNTSPQPDVAAAVILDNLSKGGRFSHRRVGVALPPGLRKHKDDVPH